MDLLHVPAPPGAFEVEVNPYFSCDFALKHIEICDLGTYAAPFMYREPTNALRHRKHMYMYVKQFEIFKGAFESLRNFRRLFEVAKMFKKSLKSEKIVKNHRGVDMYGAFCSCTYLHVLPFNFVVYKSSAPFH